MNVNMKFAVESLMHIENHYRNRESLTSYGTP